MAQRHVEVVLTAKTHEVYRDSDGHLMVVVEVFADGHLMHMLVADPRDYEDR